MVILQDTRAYFQIIGGLLQNPDLLVKGEYNLDLEDFDVRDVETDEEKSRFYKIIFSAISHLYNVESKSISVVELDNYLSKFKEQYDIFQKNKGLDYLESAKKLADESNYDSNCLTIKKFSLLRDLKKASFDIEEIYDAENETKIKKFYKMNIDDIINHYNKKIITLEQKFSGTNEGIHVGDGIDELVENYKKSPEMGVDSGINALNYYTFGLRKKFYLFSAKTGDGKTRLQAFFAIYTAVKQKIPSLFITTELEYDEIQAMILSGVSGVSERHIILNQYSEGEEEKINKAKKEIKESGLQIVYLPDFSVEKIEYIIKKYILFYKTEYVFFDYIKASMSIIASINKKTGGGLQSWQILTLLSERLKTLSAIYKVGIISSTQLTKGEDVAGAKAIVDSTDVYAKLRFATQEEIEKYELDFKTTSFNNKNYVHMFLDFEKNRRGEKNFSIGLCVNHGKLDIKETVVVKNGIVIGIPSVKFE